MKIKQLSLDQRCQHLGALEALKTPKQYVCEECVRMGGEWVHLRTCQSCGTTLCCDSSPHRHASKHAAQASHPVVISAEPGERWAWCYVDQQITAY